MNAQSLESPTKDKGDADSDSNHSSREFSASRGDYRVNFKLVQTENAARKSMADDGWGDEDAQNRK